MTTTRVLIIDDDPAVQIALPETLRLWVPGMLVDVYGSARVALDRIETTDYDAIVSDIRMPEIDGITLLERIRTIRPTTPTLLITGHSDQSVAIRALRGGAYDYIIKPIDREYFVSALKRAVQMRQLRRQTEEQKASLDRYATQLEEIVEARTRDVLNTLEQRVQERTAELMAANAACRKEILERQQAEKDLQESRHSLHAVVEAVPCLIVLTDPDGRLLMFNRTAEELTGYTREEALGKRLRDLLIPPAWEPTLQQTHDGASQSGFHAAQTTPWVTKTGQERLIEWRCTVFPYLQYEDPCVLGVGIDVTEQQATESKIRKLNTELDQQVQAYVAVVRDLKAFQAELQEKISDLEKFEEVVVGRELKMIALEKELAALQRERDRLQAKRERV